MTASGSNRSQAPAVAALDAVASAAAYPNINPQTGLSSDYLNHFTEAVMMLEMAASMPECLDELRAWRPKTYVEHIAGSHFSNRGAVIRAYQAADPAVRSALEEASKALDAALLESRKAVLQDGATAADGSTAQQVLLRLKPLMVRAAAVINGTAHGETASSGNSQTAIDAMFAR
jgi:hypothetical protein